MTNDTRSNAKAWIPTPTDKRCSENFRRKSPFSLGIRSDGAALLPGAALGQHARPDDPGDGPLSNFALALVLLAALCHASWNISAKVAAESKHFVWLFSAGSVLVYGPVVLAVMFVERPHFETRHWLALGATSILHLLYSLSLQAGYRKSDLSVVYPIARGSGPLVSFFGAVALLGESISTQSLLAMLLIVAGILLVAGIVGHHRRAPGVGVAYGLMTGALIAAYTLNDGWAVKVLLVSPFLIDFTGNLFRMLVLAPRAWRDRARVALEARTYRKPVIIVSVLGPLGYILVLFAMRLAPVSHVAPARELSTLVGAWFGSRMLRESTGPWRIVGAGLIVTGVIGLALTG
jgi:drug/metabolite transporter (DMT)-like permease